MGRWHRAFRKNDKEFKELFGVKKEIFCTAQAKSAVHMPAALLPGVPVRPNNTFRLFKTTIRAIVWGILLLADSGYQGLLALHKNSRIPYKKSKKHPLTAEQKLFNRTLSKERIDIENINTRIKTFKMMSERYQWSGYDSGSGFG